MSNLISTGKQLKFKQEEIVEIVRLSQEGMTARAINQQLNLNNYPMVAYYIRKSKGKRAKRLTHKQEQMIESKADLLQFMTKWVQKMDKAYDNVPDKKTIVNFKTGEETEVSNWVEQQNQAKIVNETLRRFTELMKEANKVPSTQVTVANIGVDKIRQIYEESKMLEVSPNAATDDVNRC